MLQNSGSFRHGVNPERAGVNPTITVALNTKTKITLGYEYLRDTRTADRGITSFRGKPADVPSTFYGNPDDSHVRARVEIGSAWSSAAFREPPSGIEPWSRDTIASIRTSSPAP